MNALAPEILLSLLTLLLKVTLLLSLTLLGCRLMRRCAAAVRHTILLCGLSVTFLLPLSLAIPQQVTYRVAVPAFVGNYSPALIFGDAALTPGPSPEDGRGEPVALVGLSKRNTITLLDTPLPSSGEGPGVRAASPKMRVSAAKSKTLKFLASFSSLPLLMIPFVYVGLCFLYSAGILITLGRFAVSLFSVRRLSAYAPPAEPGEEIAAVCRQMRITRPVAVRVSDAVSVPMTFGWRRPTILLPADADAWPNDRRRAALLHEAAHIARHDWAALLFAHVVCAVYWFHPLAWLVAARLRNEAEQAADDRVILAGIPAPDYARHLLEIARSLSVARPTPLAIVAIVERSHMETRLHALLDAARTRRVPRAAPAALLIVTLFFGGLLAPLRPQAQAQKPSPRPKVISSKLEFKSPDATANAEAEARLQAVEAQIERLTAEREMLHIWLNGGRPNAEEYADNQERRARIARAERALKNYRLQQRAGKLPAAQQALIDRLSRLKQELDYLTTTTRVAEQQVTLLTERLARLKSPADANLLATKSDNAIRLEQLTQQHNACIAAGYRSDSLTIRDLNAKIRATLSALQREQKRRGPPRASKANSEFTNILIALNDANIVAATQRERMQLVQTAIAKYERAVQDMPMPPSGRN